MAALGFTALQNKTHGGQTALLLQKNRALKQFLQPGSYD